MANTGQFEVEVKLKKTKVVVDANSEREASEAVMKQQAVNFLSIANAKCIKPPPAKK